MAVGNKFVRSWGSPFDITIVNAPDQNDPSITALDNGSFVVCWESEDATGDKSIKARVYDVFGNAITGEFVVNTTNIHTQSDPVVTALTGGKFVIAWEDDSKNETSQSEDIRAQIFSANGSKIGSEFLVNSATIQDQEAPDITTLTDGRFVVVWEDSINAETQAVDLRAQIFNADGSKSGGAFLVNSTTEENQLDPAVSALSGGRFVVAWIDNSEASHLGVDLVVVAQIFSSTGAKLGGEFVANTTISQEPSKPSVITLSDGRFLITWMHDSTLAGEQIVGQLFSSGGARIGGEFLVSTASPGNQDNSRATALHDGGFIVTWDSSTSSTNSTQWAQLFNATGTKVGTQFLIEDTPRDSEDAKITTLVDGRIVFTWEDGSLGNREDLLARIFDPRNAPVNLVGSNENNAYVGTKYNDAMAGRRGDDYLGGGAGVDTLSGGADDDWLDGDDGQDLLLGGAGEDTLYGGRHNDRLEGGLDRDRLDGNGGDDTLLGGNGKDTLSGDGGNDVLFGGSGDDLLYSSEGNDTLVGNSGDDKLWSHSGVDKLWGKDGRDTLKGGSENDSLWGGAGDDFLYGETHDDKLYGEDGNDSLFGGNGNDTLVGNGGKDKLLGHSGIDKLWGKDGSDTLDGGSGNDTLWGGAGTDFLYGGTHDDRLYGEDGNDVFFGGSGEDTLWGNSGNDTLRGGPGDDMLYGDKYDDKLYGEDGNDSLFGGNGVDILKGGGGKDSLRGGAGNDFLHGDKHDDKLYGEGGNDTLFGGNGVDILRGGGGKDILNGGQGRDAMFGGYGADEFVFFAASNSSNKKPDSIQDFATGVDKINLFAVIGPQLTFVGNSKFSGTDAEVRVTTSTDNSIVRVDVDGDGLADMRILLLDSTGLTAGDFIL